MKAELKKLKGASIKTTMGQINLKEHYRLEQSQYDQVYFKTSGVDGICKIYDLTQPASLQRFLNEKQQYSQNLFSMLYSQVSCEQIKIKKLDYGFVLFNRLDKEPSLQQCMPNLSQYQKTKLALNLIQFLQQLKDNKKIFCNIRPSNIYKLYDKFVIINAQFLRTQGSRSDMDSFMLQTIQNDWKYWPSQVADPYSHQIFDYSLDIYAVGCILYQCLTGKYPFQSKLSATNGQFVKLDNKSIIYRIVELFLSDSKNRKNINLKQIIKKLRQCNSQLKTTELIDRPYQQKNRKGSNNGIFDNISNVLSKMMNDSQGWFLNYVQDNELAPQDKYLDNILTKMYKKQQKAEKLSNIIQKFVSNNLGKTNSIKKTLLIIGMAIRKGPQAALNSLINNIASIKSLFSTSESIQSIVSLLQKKVQTNEKLKKILCGNFYLQQISNFKLLTTQQLKIMINYLQYLINFASNRPYLDKSQLSQYILNFACDEIYDLVSMIILSSISIRKDNQLQLRTDNIKQLQTIQKAMNMFLKKLSDLSNFISAHGIYSLESQYIPYQQQLMLKTNPYYSTIQYFYCSNRSYKGLTVPTDYSNAFNLNPNKQEKKVHSAHKQLKPTVQINNKSYFKQQVNSDQEDEFSRYYKIMNQVQSKKSQQTHTHKVQKKLSHEPMQKVNLKISEPKQTSSFVQSKNSNQHHSNASKESSKSNKPQLLQVSFQQFGNIYKVKSQKNSKCVINQFDFLNQVKKDPPKKDIQKKPVLPQKKETLILKPKQAKPKSTFQQFDQIFDKQKKVKQSKKVFLSPEINQLTENKSNTNFDPFFGNFANQIMVKNIQLPNPLVAKILQGLKLKQLKELITKNKNFVINFQSLKLNKVIGSGSAGEVFYGTYKEQEVAIKRVKAKQNPNALKQFERQLVTYIKIKTNPHLVSLVGVSQSNGDFYLITQFCLYGSLFDLLHKKKMQIALSWKQRLSFAIQIAQGMEFLHSMKPIIIHRDLKSLNVFVSKVGNNWKMKVADFGLSRSPEADMMTTQLGTIHWMAPQLLEGKQYSYKVDVYSYGVLLWQILSRTTPYSNLQNPMAILKYVVIDKKRPDMQFIPKQCPVQLISIMEKCWSHQPNDRPSFSEIIKLLKMIYL